MAMTYRQKIENFIRSARLMPGFKFMSEASLRKLAEKKYGPRVTFHGKVEDAPAATKARVLAARAARARGYTGMVSFNRQTGQAVDNRTKQPIPGIPNIDSKTGTATDPATGVTVDPATGQPVSIDPATGKPVDPTTGQPTGMSSGTKKLLLFGGLGVGALVVFMVLRRRK
jgi:hypothetical protein